MSTAKVIYKGVTFKSLRALARHVNINPMTLSCRLKKGMTLDVACENAVKHSINLVFEGQSFKSVIQFSKYYNLNAATTQSRFNRGWSLEKILRDRPKEKSVIVRNKKFKCLAHACKYYNINLLTVITRLEKNWSLEEALEIDKKVHNTKCCGILYMITNRINNKKYIGITTNSLDYRWRHHLYAVNRGSNTKLAKAIRKYGKANFDIKLLKTTNSKKKLRDLEIKYINHYNSVEKGYNSVIGGCCLGHNVGHITMYKGLEFISIRSLAKHLKLPYHTVRYRLQKGEYKNVA